MGVPVQNFLKARRDRAVATLMGYLERNHFNGLGSDEQAALRGKVLEAIDGYHDAVLDLVKSEDDVRNERVIDLLESLEQHMKRQPAK